MEALTTREAMSREELCSELSMIEASGLIALADECVAGESDVMITRPPTVGSVVAQVREPVAEQRFILADVLACSAEVSLRGHLGWGMRMGADRRAALAAAICDAEVVSAGPYATRVIDLCREGRARREAERAAEWTRLAPSIVEFEEIP
jgi:alpha-D-ribose 1-methylphosphonate 5-triphosphate synthase subunit PhnG